jgi:hypothetical protein
VNCVALFVDGPYFDVRTKDCQNFWNLKVKELTARWDDDRFEIYQVPAHNLPPSGYAVDDRPDSDGASLPMPARMIRPSLRERIFGAGFVHDAGFRKLLLVKRGDEWVNANLSEEDCNALIKALMFIEATSDAEREIVYEALQLWGKKAYDLDAKAAASLSPGVCLGA